LPEVDADRIGVWGTSYAGGHVLVLAATDRRIRAVVAQVPTISGYQQGLRRVPPDAVTALEHLFDDDERAQFRGEPPRRQQVVGDDPSVPAAISFYLQPLPSGAWMNEVTVRSGRLARMYEPGAWIARVSPTPLLMIVALADHITLTDLGRHSSLTSSSRSTADISILTGAVRCREHRGSVLVPSTSGPRSMTEASQGNQPLQWKLFIRRRASATQGTPPGKDELKWVANTTTLIHGEQDALLVDTFLSEAQTGELADWIAASGRRLSTIYITHAHPDHFFGLKLLRDRFPEARAIAPAQVVDAMQATLAPEAVENWRKRFPGQIPSDLVSAERLDGGTFDLEGHEIVPIDIDHTDTDRTTSTCPRSAS
jgi:Metallo-beta-lactamase superfamily/Acetyl xylan esterase (AXE1)